MLKKKHDSQIMHTQGNSMDAKTWRTASRFGFLKRRFIATSYLVPLERENDFPAPGGGRRGC